MTTIAQGAPRLAFEVDDRLSPNHVGYGPMAGAMRERTLVFGDSRSFTEGGVGQIAAGVGHNALGGAARSAMLSHPNDFNSLASYAFHYDRIRTTMHRLDESGDMHFQRELRDMVHRGRTHGDWTMLSQTAFDTIVDDIVNRELQMAPSAPDSSYEMWIRLMVVDFWRDEGYKVSELNGPRGAAPELGTDISAPERIRATDTESTFHMKVYAKEVEIRWYEGIADHINYVPEIMRLFAMSAQDTEAMLACDLVVDETNGIDTTFFSVANRNLIGYSGIGTHPGVSDVAIETGIGEFRDQISRASMPISGAPMYLVATPLAAARAQRVLSGFHNDVRGAAVEINRLRPNGVITASDVLTEPYFKTALDNPAVANSSPSQAAQGLWMMVGGMDRPPAFIRIRHRSFMSPMLLRRNPQWGMGEVEPVNRLFFTMIGFGQYDPRGATASRNGLERPV